MAGLTCAAGSFSYVAQAYWNVCKRRLGIHRLNDVCLRLYQSRSEGVLRYLILIGQKLVG